ncbi:MAG: restriction endonuclease subunit M [Candidatus Hodarchaeota archaeon]
MSNNTGYIKDFISGKMVKATPEQIEAIQPFSRKLVEEYGYDKKQIQTIPQYRVPKRPSEADKKQKTYPVDIAVFTSENKTDENLFMLVECKRKTRKDGEKQLKIYLELSHAQIGIWYNGKAHLYLHKVFDKNGRMFFKQIFSIPKKGQRLEDVGKHKRKHLIVPKNLKIIFKDIRNYLAGMAVGITRDEVFAQEITYLLFCKIYDEINTELENEVKFRAGIGEDEKEVKKRIVNLFEDEVKKEYDDVLEKTDKLTLDKHCTSYVVGELQNYCITEATRDAIGDAFEVFIGPALKGSQGQFFTPRNVVRMAVNILDPRTNESFIDPACGSGGFLVVTLEYVWRKLEEEAKKKGWSDVTLEREKMKLADRNLRAIDKDNFLSKVAKAYMTIVGNGRETFCENSLLPPKEWGRKTQDKINLNSFDIMLTNPPFGSKIKVAGSDILSQYELGHKWKRNKKSNKWEKTNKLREDVAPQVLFIERCLQLLKPGGRMGIVLPDGILGNDTDGYIRTFILKQAKILAIVDMPVETFMPSVSTKTSMLFLQKKKAHEHIEDYPIFIAVAEKCGHDRRGKEIEEDDMTFVAEEYKKFIKENNIVF